MRAERPAFLGDTDEMIYILISIVVIALDQLTKVMIRTMPMDYEYRIIGDFLKIVHVENSGAAFGLFAGDTKFLLIFPAAVIAAAVVFILNDKDGSLAGMIQKVSLTLIASGGVGNMIDRFLFGHVTDMISFSIFPPVFNVADIAVTCGCAMLVLSLIFGEKSISYDDRKSDEDR